MNEALLIVDVQKGFVNERTKHIPNLIEHLQYDYDIVIATRFINLPNSAYRRLINWNNLSPNSDEVELAFQPKQGTFIIDKYNYSCLNDEFLSILNENEINSIDLCGMDLDICVTKCAVDLFEHDVVPYVLKDYCATNADEQIKSTALKILARFIGKSQII